MLGKLKQTEELGRHTLSKTLILSPNIEKKYKKMSESGVSCMLRVIMLDLLIHTHRINLYKFCSCLL